MTVCNYSQVKDFQQRHVNCDVVVKLSNDDKSTVVMRCPYHSQTIVASIPYRTFCLDHTGCAGLGSCPRSYACSE